MTCTVVIATYNGSKFIVEQLDSIFKQTRIPDQLIISDDFSNDNTIALCEEKLKDYQGNYVITRNKRKKGVTNNFFNGLELCNGDIIFLCDQDDIWFPNKIERMMRVFEENPHCSLCLCDAYIWDQDKVKGDNYSKCMTIFDSLNISGNIGKINLDSYIEILIERNVITGMCIAFKRTVVKDWPSDLVYLHDTYLGLACAVYGEIYFLKEKLALYRQHNGNVLGMSKKNLMKKLKKFCQKNVNAIIRENERLRFLGDLDEKYNLMNESNKIKYIKKMKMINMRYKNIVNHRIISMILMNVKMDIYKKQYSWMIRMRDILACIVYKGEPHENL